MPQTFVSPLVLDCCQQVSVESLTLDLSSGKCRGVAYITCSELGVRIPGIPTHPELPIYVWQNLGACLDEGFSLNLGDITDIIVYGHYPCSLVDIGVKGDAPLLAEKVGGLLHSLSSLTSAVRQEIQSRFGDRRDEAVLRTATELHIMRQLELASQLPEVLKAIDENRIRFGAWMQVPGSLKPLAYDRCRQQFC